MGEGDPSSRTAGFGMTQHLGINEGGSEICYGKSPLIPLLPDKDEMSFRMEPHLSEAKGWRNEESHVLSKRNILTLLVA
jgi:hypothetical protein